MVEFKVGDWVQPDKNHKDADWATEDGRQWPGKVERFINLDGILGDIFLIKGMYGRWSANGLELAKPKYLENK